MPQIYVDIYFEQQNDSSNNYKCVVCPNTYRKKSGTSWANLLSHLNDKHRDWEAQVAKVLAGGALDLYVDKEGKIRFLIVLLGTNMYRWIHQVVCHNLPFSFVDNYENRRNSCLTHISSKSLKSAISVVTKKVEEYIARILPAKFALIIDGWSS